MNTDEFKCLQQIAAELKLIREGIDKMVGVLDDK